MMLRGHVLHGKPHMLHVTYSICVTRDGFCSLERRALIHAAAMC